jgi:hypothetical protein
MHNNRKVASGGQLAACARQLDSPGPCNGVGPLYTAMLD